MLQLQETNESLGSVEAPSSLSPVCLQVYCVSIVASPPRDSGATQPDATALYLFHLPSSSSLHLLVNSHHFHITLQLADTGPLALGGAHVTQVMDGDGRTDTGIQLSDCQRKEPDGRRGMSGGGEAAALAVAAGAAGLTTALHPKLLPAEDVVEEVLQLRWTQTHQALSGLLSYTHPCTHTFYFFQNYQLMY